MKKKRNPYHDHKGVITKKLENSPELAPNLVVSVKKLSGSKYYIAIIHPNTKEILYEKNTVSYFISYPEFETNTLYSKWYIS